MSDVNPDRYITGNYGEDQFSSDSGICEQCEMRVAEFFIEGHEYISEKTWVPIAKYLCRHCLPGRIHDYDDGTGVKIESVAEEAINIAREKVAEMKPRYPESQEVLDELAKSPYFGDVIVDILFARGAKRNEFLKIVDAAIAKASRLPDSIQEALNSGDGTYRP